MNHQRRTLSKLGLAVALAGAAIQLLLGCYYLAMAHAPKPHHLPVGISAPAEERSAIVPQLERDGSFRVEEYSSADALVAAVKERKAYGGYVHDAKGPTLYVASAASPAVANLLKGMYSQEYERRIADSVGKVTAAGGPVPAATAARLAQPPAIVDLVPLPKADSAGSSLGFLIQALSLGASIASMALGQLGKRVDRSTMRGLGHAALLVVYALLSGGVALLAMSFYGVGRGADHAGLFVAFSLVSLAITASTAAAVALVGRAGALVGALYFTLGLIISGSSIAPEMLPHAGRTIGRLLPPGAGASFIRDRLYFPDASDHLPLLVLAAFACVGLLVVLARNALAGRTTTA
ncbi:ABC transporter permease [Nocardioides jiangxiensis]|uniref:ABC transporter permease n=1 Tax=Nocardioides jiangxiensis TaxID=3064524 RepID=A0ABT9B1P3_9ACTN|nr:ABC transporter permease [Nocardioides sp. WY-20]MDO7868781.1 ABC transporter permease [Nocardioides sp. WY-20]